MDTNKDKLFEIPKELNDWINDELKTKGYVLGSEVQDRLDEETEYRKFIENEIKKPWKRPND